MYNFGITVFTPTFNRGYIIENLYRSLQQQTYKNFEWIVIDDGSSDDTEKLFKKWIKEDNFFQIKYVFVENGGKHRAINRGIDIANGKLFFIVDSDDYITNDALEKIINWADTLKRQSEKYAGVAGNRGYNKTEIIGTTFDGNYLDATSIEKSKNNISGDKSEVFFTSVLKKYKFPEFEDENFITECVVWDKIAWDGLKIRWFNDIIYICNYLEDGLTKSGNEIFIKNPKGYAFYVNQHIKYHKYSIKQQISIYYKYYDELCNILSKEEICKNLNIKKAYLYFIIILKKFKDILIG